VTEARNQLPGHGGHGGTGPTRSNGETEKRRGRDYQVAQRRPVKNSRCRQPAIDCLERYSTRLRPTLFSRRLSASFTVSVSGLPPVNRVSLSGALDHRLPHSAAPFLRSVSQNEPLCAIIGSSPATLSPMSRPFHPSDRRESQRPLPPAGLTNARVRGRPRGGTIDNREPIREDLESAKYTR
jgi:hypothetical protein